MKRYVRALPVLLLLAGCRAQPPAPTPTPEPTPVPEVSGAPEAASVGIEVDIGDGAHTFWVELAEAEVGKTVNIYREKGDPKPLQSFTDEEALLDLEMAELTAEDVNFDSYMDFHYCTSTGYALVSHSSYYVWDPNTEQFQADPYGLNELSTAEFLPYNGEITSLSQGPLGWTMTYYQYETDALVQTGQQEDWTDHSDWRVRVNDENILLVRAECRGEPRRDFPESDMGLTLTVYREGEETQPIQIIETGTMKWKERFRLAVRDVNFDGDMDFYYTYSEGLHGNGYRCFYVWDRETGTFLPDPYGLNGLMNADIDKENQAVTEYERGTDWERENYYRYALDTGELRLFRSLYYGGWGEVGEMAVTDYRQGEALLVYSAESEELFSGPEYEEFSRWRDLDYSGK